MGAVTRPARPRARGVVRQTLVIQNVSGLHARAAAKLVQLCEKYKSSIKLIRGRSSANAKSIMGVMMLEAARGARLTVVARGADASPCVRAIARLIDGKFGEAK